MKVDKTLVASVALHVLVIGWGLVSFSSKAFESIPEESLPVDVISSDQLAKVMAGMKSGKKENPKPLVEKVAKVVTMQPDFTKRGAIRSSFDGRYRFSRYFSPVNFNRPTTYEALIANNDLEVYDLQQDPQETRNLALDGKAKGELIMALNSTLNARIDEEVGEDDGSFLPLLRGLWYPARL